LSQTVNKATPVITWSNPADIAYPTALSGTQLNATANVPGSFAYTPASGTVLNAGANQTLTANFTPTDTANYNNNSKTVSINVNKADQTITGFGAIADKTYGDADFKVSATGGGSGNPVTFTATGECSVSQVAGDWMVHITGAGSCTVTAHQAGNSNYNAAPDVPQSFNIAKADATINVQGYTGVYDGDPHGATGSATGVGGANLNSQLNLGDSFTNVPGGTAHWTFDGGTTYNDAEGNVAITINKADAVINVQGFDGTYDGDPHGATTATATGADGSNLSSLLHVSGSFTNVPGGTGNWTFDGDNNHKDASGTFEVKIAKANATINVNGYSGVYDGQAHGASGTATGVKGESLTSLLDLGGSFTNVPGGTANWNFAGNGNYNSKTGSVAITINKATPTIEWDNPAAIDHGTALSNTQLNAIVKGVDNSVLAGNSVYTPAAGTVLPAGTHTLKVAFTPNDTGNYNGASKEVQITVSAYNFGNGFFQPVDNRMANGVKGGSTVPMKFEVFQSLSGNELKSTSAIKTWTTSKVNCTTMASLGEDAIEQYVTGGTSLRWDTTGDFFILNWQAPKAPVGTCYTVNVFANDGSANPATTLTAFFRIR
jgi:hypothetical protein